jgi:hypothetical protein
MELSAVIEYLLTKGFITVTKGKAELTPLFHKSYTGIQKVLVLQGTKNPLPVVAEPALQVPTAQTFREYTYEAWVKLYMQFISESQVPRRLITNHGDPYDANKFSEDGLKAFQKALTAGAIYHILVKSVTLYYGGANRYKKAIGNYMSQGDWRTDYMDLLTSAQQGAEQVSKHIKDTVNGGTKDRYEWG